MGKYKTEDIIAGNSKALEALRELIIYHFLYAKEAQILGLGQWLKGLLLFGPPGTGKWCSLQNCVRKMLETGKRFCVKYSKYHVKLPPSIIFLDQVDAIARKRGDGGDSSSNDAVGERLLSTLLTEMDGLEEATGIIVLGATNHPQAIDAALMRPGRFDLVLHVPPPDIEGRYEILRIKTRKMRLGEDVDLMQVALCTELFTGADLERLCVEAGHLALRENTEVERGCVYARHFHTVMNNGLKPSLTKSQIEEYDAKFNRG